MECSYPRTEGEPNRRATPWPRYIVRLGVMWQVRFTEYDLGYFDLESCRVEPGPNPFGPKVLTL